ncbi:MAG: FUSC family protein [Solirubrobacteraceae bacterium]
MLTAPRERASAILARGWRRVRIQSWSIVQQAVAGTVAWVIASRLVKHHVPFFAPIAAVAGLNAPLGRRGTNALKLLLGVFIGIAVGQATIITIGGGVGSLPVALFIAMCLAAALGGTNLTRAQAAIGVILTVTLSQSETGINRLVDALIGAAVALGFSQLLFPPDPLRLVRRAEAASLRQLSHGLAMTATASERSDRDAGVDALQLLWKVRDQLAELGQARRASRRVVKHSLMWRRRRAPVVRVTEDTAHLDSLAATSQTVARTVLAADADDQRRLAPAVEDLARVLGKLADDPGSSQVRQRAAEQATQVGDELPALTRADLGPALAAAVVALQLLIDDILIFVGVEDPPVG